MTREGKQLWLTGHSGASTEFLQDAMRLMVEDPASYARIISHVAPYRAASGVFGRLLAAGSQNIMGVPGVKVISDFTDDGDEIDVFEPERWLQRGVL